MTMLKREWQRLEDCRPDVHPLAIVDTDYPMMACVECGLPVPMEDEGNIYCCQSCEDTAMEEALWQDRIDTAKAIIAAEREADIFAKHFPEVVDLREPSLHDLCSCHAA